MTNEPSTTTTPTPLPAPTPTTPTKPQHLPPQPKNGTRHSLPPESELRLELPPNTICTLLLLSGSAELFGAELACHPSLNASTAASMKAVDEGIGRSGGGEASVLMRNDDERATKDRSSVIYIKQRYTVVGQANFAILTWYGCLLDVEVEFGKGLGMSYTSDEIAANVAYVNTNAQLEALRDEAMRGEGEGEGEGPRVLVVGPADSGKTSLIRVLSAYAIKLGRSPILVDIDPSQNMLSIPGTLTASSPLLSNSISVSTHACHSSGSCAADHPLVLWYGSADPKNNVDLYKAQVGKLGRLIEARLEAKPVQNASDNADGNKNARCSGILVNTSSWIEEGGYDLLLHAVSTLRITVILVMGHDRLYSMLNNHFPKEATSSSSSKPLPKVIKLPRSGGVVSRDESFRLISQGQSIKRYFYGTPNLPPPQPTASTAASVLNAETNTSGIYTTILSSASVVDQYTPTALEISFAEMTIYRLTAVSLSSDMLPISAKQATAAVQLELIEDISISLKQCVLAVCHPSAVEAYERRKKEGLGVGDGSDGEELYLCGVAGMVVVEKVDMERESLKLLSPSGSLPSMTLLLGDVVWHE